MFPTLQQITTRLDKELKTASIQDQSLNGLQVETPKRIARVAIAVDATLDTIQAAVEKRANLLIVHHGLFWGQSSCITGPLYSKIQILVKNQVGLYASHLPLDLHPKMGNNALLAKALKLQRIEPFGIYHGEMIGCGGQFAKAIDRTKFGEKVNQVTGGTCRQFHFGKKSIKKVAIVSGGSGDMVVQAAEKNYDAFFTGEIAHPVYHSAKENQINMITGGHYATETLGVKAVGQFLQRIYKIKCVFLDFPTGL